MKSTLLLLFISISLVSNFSWAKRSWKKKSHKKYMTKVMKKAPFKKSTFEPKWYTKADMKNINKRVKKHLRWNRKIASVKGESALKEDYTEFRAEFLAVKTPDELHALLARYNGKYDTLSNDTKLLVAQLTPLSAMRGFVWKLSGALSDNTALHSYLLTFARSTASSIVTLYPHEHWKVGFDYFTQPYMAVDSSPKGAGAQYATEKFEDEADIHAQFAGPILDQLKVAMQRIETLQLDEPVIFDNQLVYSNVNYRDAADRYRVIGEAERLAMLAGLHFAIAQIDFSRVYSIEGTLATSSRMGKLYGFDDPIPWIDIKTVTGAPARDRYAAIREEEGLGLRMDDYKEWSESAYTHMGLAINRLEATHKAFKERGSKNSEQHIFNGELANLFDGITQDRLTKLKELFAPEGGEVELRSVVTGETIRVNMKDFYQEPPKDLKTVLAIGFVSGDEEISMSKVSKERALRRLKFRNYLWGRPNTWSVRGWNALKAHMPSLAEYEKVCNEDGKAARNRSCQIQALEAHARIAENAYGGLRVGLPLWNLVL